MKPAINGKPHDGDVRQCCGKTEQSVHQRRQQEYAHGGAAQAETQRQLVAEQPCGDAEKADQRADRQHAPALHGKVALPATQNARNTTIHWRMPAVPQIVVA